LRALRAWNHSQRSTSQTKGGYHRLAVSKRFRLTHDEDRRQFRQRRSRFLARGFHHSPSCPAEATIRLRCRSSGKEHLWSIREELGLSQESFPRGIGSENTNMARKISDDCARSPVVRRAKRSFRAARRGSLAYVVRSEPGQAGRRNAYRGQITNGVHVPSWLAPANVSALYDRPSALAGTNHS